MLVIFDIEVENKLIAWNKKKFYYKHDYHLRKFQIITIGKPFIPMMQGLLTGSFKGTVFCYVIYHQWCSQGHF